MILTSVVSDLAADAACLALVQRYLYSLQELI